VFLNAFDVCAESVESNSKCKIKKVFENTFFRIRNPNSKEEFLLFGLSLKRLDRFEGDYATSAS
ncbi:MAG: hypothetical protein KIG59_00450, partial [Muribaculaceae bacterium]|nr:hypothetical protein [Muribaculaceae bacterium]